MRCEGSARTAGDLVLSSEAEARDNGPTTHPVSAAVHAILGMFFDKKRNECHECPLELQCLICMKLRIRDGIENVSDDTADEMGYLAFAGELTYGDT